jgi:acyl-CoA thioesterase
MPQESLRLSANELLALDRVASSLFNMQLRESRAGYARLTMRVRDTMVNGHLLCHGGIIFALADTALALASNVGYPATVATSATIDFLRPAYADDELTAIAQERLRSRKSGIYDVEVRNQANDCIALFRARARQFPRPEPAQ